MIQRKQKPENREESDTAQRAKAVLLSLQDGWISKPLPKKAILEFSMPSKRVKCCQCGVWIADGEKAGLAYKAVKRSYPLDIPQVQAVSWACRRCVRKWLKEQEAWLGYA